MAIAQVDGRQVEYALEGRGEPVLLLAASWWPLDTWQLSGIPELRDDYQVLAPNQRGIGRSTGTEGPYSARQQAADAVALMDALGITGSAHVLGFAQGSGIALQLAVHYPERARSLVLAAPSPGAPASEPAPSLRERAHIAHQGFQEFIRKHALNDDFAFTAANYAAHRDRAEGLADALWDHQGTEEEFLKHADARQGYDALADAARVRQPALVLCGEEDDVQRGRHTPVGTARELAKALPHARLHLIPNVRHMTFWEDPAAAWAPVKAFLAASAVRGQ